MFSFGVDLDKQSKANLNLLISLRRKILRLQASSAFRVQNYRILVDLERKINAVLWREQSARRQIQSRVVPDGGNILSDPLLHSLALLLGGNLEIKLC